MRKFIKARLPDQNSLGQARWFRWFGPALHHPGLWRLNRRSVAGGAFAGLFCGLLPAPFQMLSAALLALVFHWNLPLAVFVTFYTNPVTFVPLYLMSLWIGLWIFSVFGWPVGESTATTSSFPPPPDFALSAPVESLLALANWMLGLGWPLVVGVLALAMGLGLLGYLLVWSVWPMMVHRARRRRLQRPRAPSA